MFQLSFDTDSSTFEGWLEGEVVNTLVRVAKYVEEGQATGKFQNILDRNGNTIGTWKLNPEETR